MPVRVGGIWVNPGDLLHGDRNGVTTIPNELAAQRGGRLIRFMAAESVVLDYFKAGNANAAGYATARDECKRQSRTGRRLKSQAAVPMNGEAIDGLTRPIAFPDGSAVGPRSQVVRQRFAKPSFPGSNPGEASRFS